MHLPVAFLFLAEQESIPQIFGLNWPGFIAQVIAFSIVLYVLKTYAFGPIIAVLEERRRRIAEGQANAEKIKAQLAESEAKHREMLDKANARSQKLIDEARQSGEAVKQRAVAGSHGGGRARRRPRPRADPARTRPRAQRGQARDGPPRHRDDLQSHRQGAHRGRSAPSRRGNRPPDCLICFPVPSSLIPRRSRMKITKEARQLSRQLFRLSLTDDRIDRAKVNSLVQSVITKKPRHYLGALESFQRLLRLEMDKRHAVIESAAPLSDDTSASIVQNLKQKYGAGPDHRVQGQPGTHRRDADQDRQRRVGRQRQEPPRPFAGAISFSIFQTLSHEHDSPRHRNPDRQPQDDHDQEQRGRRARGR